MPLALDKLEKLISSQGFFISTYFVMDGYIFYIELISVVSSNIFLLYIPSKYNFSLSKGSNVYKIKYVDISGDKVEDDGDEAKEIYNKINISPGKDENIENHLENHYKKTISMDSISSDDQKNIKALYRQVKRLSYCVEEINYKLAVFYRNYICAVRRDNSVDCFGIKKFNRDKDNKRLSIIVDLETFYDDSQVLDRNIDKVEGEIFSILKKNQKLHSTLIAKLLESNDIIKKFLSTGDCGADIDSVNKLRVMMNKINNREEKLSKELYDLETRRRTSVGIQNDAEISIKKKNIDEELNEVSALKEQIMKTLVDLKDRNGDRILTLDKIMFDNIVMTDSVIKNLQELKKFIE